MEIFKTVPEIPGLIYTGETFKGLPLYDFAPPPEGRPSINTLEGWNLMRREGIMNRLRRRLGREPSEAEYMAEDLADRQLARRNHCNEGRACV